MSEEIKFETIPDAVFPVAPNIVGCFGCSVIFHLSVRASIQEREGTLYYRFITCPCCGSPVAKVVYESTYSRIQEQLWEEKSRRDFAALLAAKPYGYCL